MALLAAARHEAPREITLATITPLGVVLLCRAALVTLYIAGSSFLGPDQSVNICPGGSANLTALYVTASNTASWFFGGAPFTTPTSATTAGVYTLVATSAAGCTDSAD